MPDGTSGKCLDPGKQGAGLGNNVCVGGGWVSKPSQALPTLFLQKGSSTVETQQLWRKCVLKVLPTHSSPDTAESDSYQSERSIFARTIYQHVQMTSYTFYSVNMCV